jgi:hypothetical protein
LLTVWLLDIVKELIEEHKRLVLAVKERDTQKALSLLDSHIHKLNIEETMLERLFPDYFVDSVETQCVVDFGGLSMS